MSLAVSFKVGKQTIEWHRSIDDLRQRWKGRGFVLMDEAIAPLYAQHFPGLPLLPLPSGEACKTFAVAEQAVGWLLENGADRHSVLVGVGGGALTDLAGFVASVFMRGIAFHAVPTTVLAMVDAAWGGKNGLNTAVYKNMAGTIRQPEAVLTDLLFLDSLPDPEWRNGFAEIVKHAMLGNQPLMTLLQQHSLPDFRQNKSLLAQCIDLNVKQKMAVVMMDAHEKSARKQLNFGHTLGHALEKTYPQHHGFAVAKGMVFATWIGDELEGSKQLPVLLLPLLEKLDLPVYEPFDVDAIVSKMLRDKKNRNRQVQMVLLSRNGYRLQDFSSKQIEAYLRRFQQIFAR